MTRPDESVHPSIVDWPADSRDRAALAARAAAIIQSGGVVVFPTDTVYGIAAHPLQATAVNRIFAVKRRPEEKRIALLVGGIDDIDKLATDVPDSARTLAQAAWPGALTIVFSSLREELGPTVALRWPDHEVPLAIIRAVDFPLATTSANLSSEPSPRTAADVLGQIPLGYELLIDGGSAPGGVDSTVIDFSTNTPRLLRRGALHENILTEALGASTVRMLLS
jgi:L-threonylcarbamoyladenylate synthase